MGGEPRKLTIAANTPNRESMVRQKRDPSWCARRRDWMTALILVVAFVTSRSTDLLRRVHQENMDQLNALIEGKIVGALHSSAVSQLLTCFLGLQRPASRRPDLPAPSHHLRHHRLSRRLCYTEYRIYSRNYGRRHPRHTSRTSLPPPPLTPRSLYRPGASSDKIQ